MSTPRAGSPEPVYSPVQHATASQLSRDAEQNINPPRLAPLNTLNLPSSGDFDNVPSPYQIRSPSHTREEKFRTNDDLELMKAERVASKVSRSSSRAVDDITRSRSKRHRSRSREPIDEFDESVNPVHQIATIWAPPAKPKTKLAVILKGIHESSILIRYFTYIVPVVLILLIPILLAAFLFSKAHVELMWFSVWLMIVWLSLWAGRILAKCLPYAVHLIASAFTNSSKKWRDMARMLELPATLFFWWLAVFISFLPTMTNHHIDGNNTMRYWENRTNIVILSLFIAMALNFAEKIIIQLIAISFHQRTYEDRIILNKFQIGSLAKLYAFSKAKLTEMEGGTSPGAIAGTRTSMRILHHAKTNAHQAFTKIGDAFGKVAGDFTGRKISKSGSPERVVLTLLQTTDGSQALARRLYRTFIRPGQDNVMPEDFKEAFSSEEASDAAFQMFDRDLNGDISCEEMELSIAEVGRERKAIIASLKDLDSVISKLDGVFTFIVAVIVVLVFLSLISSSTASIITSASGTVLALSWLFSATAQEFLASIIFVFVKHPFDVGDRVDIINTGAGTGDTFYVKEIAIMYTEFRKLQGHVVQAPNSLLNTLFILNMRRSGALAEAVPIKIKFGTTLTQIDELRQRMLDFVCSENREYQGKILTELVDIPDMHSVKLNVVFFYKSNWQNELVRLSRRNKFMCALMDNVNAVGIESPNMRWPGQKPSAPVYLQAMQEAQLGHSVVDRGDLDPSGTDGVTAGGMKHFPSMVASDTAPPPASSQGPATSIPHGILRKPSHSSSSAIYHQHPAVTNSADRRVDFSLGVSSTYLTDDSIELFEDRKRQKNPGMLSPAALDRVREEIEEDLDQPQHSHRDHLAIGLSSGVDVSPNPPSSLAGASVRSALCRWGSKARRGSVVSLDSGGTSARGNRFFGRQTREEVVGQNLDRENDLESGREVSPAPLHVSGAIAAEGIEIQQKQQ
ncbi:Mechanosensitive ion channel-domain-containing protein [Terfezia claveryi]|nr:Mechanosensitive ion channel-domain-containing protein [Terfezia claveryi]